MSKIIKCKYAGDPSDEGCKVCDGIKLVEGNQTFDATECGGYEVEEVAIEEAVNTTPAETAESCEEPHEEEQLSKLPIKGITSIIRAESGVSREINGTWYKFMFCEERVLPEGADVEAEKQALWDAVNAEVDAQVEAVRG